MRRRQWSVAATGLWVLSILLAWLGQGVATFGADNVLAERKRLVDTSDERVSVLSNGLTVILKVHRTAPVVSVRMYCRTGSIYEQEYLGAGMSHLFEHLLHGGETTTWSEEESRRILDEIGGNTNAYTSLALTCYYINTMSDHVGESIDLLGEWLTHPTFPESAFAREREVVQRELERDVDNPDRQLWYLTQETMFPGHPARFPVIGHQSIVQKLSNEDIIGYYRRMYVPDNIVISIAGDIDLNHVMSVVQVKFADFERRRLPTVTLPEVVERTTPITVTKRMKVESAILKLAWPSIPLRHPDLYALDVLSYILTQGESSRLVRTVRDAGLTFSIDSSSWTPEWGRGVFSITARLAPDKIEQARSVILQQIDWMRNEPITSEELRQAQRQKAAEHVFGMQTAEDIAERMAWDYLSTGDVHFSQAYVDQIQRVTAEQVLEIVRKYLDPQRLATILVVPEQAPVGLAGPAPVGEPEPIRMIELDNGLRCLIRRDPSTPLVAIQAFSIGGVYVEDDKTSGLSRLAAMLAPRGTVTRSAEQIARFFDSRGGSLVGGSGNNTIFFKSQVLKEDFALALQVFADMVIRPIFPGEELETYRPRQLDAIRRINETWSSELFAYFQKNFYDSSPYRLQVVGSEDVVASATHKDVAEFYHKHVTAANTVLAIFGDVDVREAVSLVHAYFSVMPRGEKTTVNVPDEPALAADKLLIKQKSADRQAAGMAIGFSGTTLTNTEDAAPLAVLDTIISGYHLPTGWLHDSLRGGDRSYVYVVHAANRPGISPGCFMIYAACEPDKVNDVYAIITEQLDRARRGQFSEAELSRAKSIIRTTESMTRQANADLAMQAALDELYGLGYDYRSQFIASVESVTLADVGRVAAKYFATPVVTVVTPAPEAVDIGIAPLRIDSDESAGASE
jgi:zinc protease